MRGAIIPKRAGRQRGATAVEFALLFPFLFAVIYGGITYGFVFFLQQRVNFAAQEGVRAAVALNPDDSNYNANLVDTVNQAVLYSFSATGAAQPRLSIVPPTAGLQPNTIVVRVNYDLAGLFPTIMIPQIGPVPSVPPTLTAVATGRVS